MVDRIRADQTRLEQVDQLIARAESEVASVEGAIEELEARERGLEASLARLASYANVDESARDNAQRLSGELAGLDKEPTLEPQPPVEVDPVLARYRAEREALYARQAGARKWTVGRVAWTALVVLTFGIALACPGADPPSSRRDRL